MPQLIVDPMNAAAQWSALQPDGATASTEIALTDDATDVRFGADKKSGRLEASTDALDHRLQRVLPGLDLAKLDDLRFSFKSSRLADGSPVAPFYLEVRLASAAMGLADPGNTWRRFVPVAQANTWDLVRLSLDDLPAAVRAAVTLIQLRCADASVSFVANIDDVVAVREEMIGDVDAALLALLHNQVSIGGTPVPAMIAHPENPPALPVPSIRISQYRIRYARERTTFARSRSDYSGSGFRMSPPCIHYDLYYIVDAYGSTRQDKTQVMEFILRTLSPRTELPVNGVPLALEWETIEPLDDTGMWRGDRELLYFKVATCQQVGAFEHVKPPFASISLVTDQT